MIYAAVSSSSHSQTFLSHLVAFSVFAKVNAVKSKRGEKNQGRYKKERKILERQGKDRDREDNKGGEQSTAEKQ